MTHLGEKPGQTWAPSELTHVHRQRSKDRTNETMQIGGAADTSAQTSRISNEMWQWRALSLLTAHFAHFAPRACISTASKVLLSRQS